MAHLDSARRGMGEGSGGGDQGSEPCIRAPDCARFVAAHRATRSGHRGIPEAGGKVIAGTDAGAMPGLSLHYELQMLVDAGIPPMKVLQAATLWGAESFGQ